MPCGVGLLVESLALCIMYPVLLCLEASRREFPSFVHANSRNMFKEQGISTLPSNVDVPIIHILHTSIYAIASQLGLGLAIVLPQIYRPRRHLLQ